MPINKLYHFPGDYSITDELHFGYNPVTISYLGIIAEIGHAISAPQKAQFSLDFQCPAWYTDINKGQC